MKKIALIMACSFVTASYASGRYTEEFPLHAAIKAGNMDLVETLLSAEQDPYNCDYQRDTPMAVAIKHGHFKAVTLLIGKDVNPREAVTGDGRNALKLAKDRNQSRILAYLVALRK